MLRFAASTKENMHLSKLRVAIFNYIVSKQLNEGLVIRIEDTQNDEKAQKEILEILNLFSIEHERVIHQSDSLKYHQNMAMQLLTKKKAFVCYCGNDKIEELKQKAQDEGKEFSYDGFCETLSDELVLNTNAPFTVRVKKPEGNIKFIDSLNGNIEYKPSSIDSFVILNHDKTPTHNYACAIDDMIINASTIIEEDKYLLDSARQIHIRKSLNYTVDLNYTHIPNLVFDKEYSVKELIDEGYLPSAIANYLVLLGNDKFPEIFTLEEAVSWFDINKVSKEAVKFDIEKLKEINKKHLENIDDMRLSKILGFADGDIGKLAKSFLSEVNTISELKKNIDLIFQEKSTCENYEKEFVNLKLCLQKAPFFEKLEDLKAYAKKNTSLEGEKLDKPLNYILSGRNDKVCLETIYPLIKNYLGEIIK